MRAFCGVVSAEITSHSVLGVRRMFLTRSISPMSAPSVFSCAECTSGESAPHPARTRAGCDNRTMEDARQAVEIRGLTFAYGRRPILRGIDLDIPSGKIVAILGISGSGKSTLLQLMGGLLTPTAGEVTVCGENVHKLDGPALRELRKRMGMMFQKGGLFTDMTVYDNVAFPMREHTRLPESVIHDLVLMKLR